MDTCNGCHLWQLGSEGWMYPTTVFDSHISGRQALVTVYKEYGKGHS